MQSNGAGLWFMTQEAIAYGFISSAAQISLSMKIPDDSLMLVVDEIPNETWEAQYPVGYLNKW